MGNCLVGTQVVVPVRCTHEHDSKIVAQVGAKRHALCRLRHYVKDMVVHESV